MKTAIEQIIADRLPNFWFSVTEGTGFFGGANITIKIASIDRNINNVSGQRPDCVSLILQLISMELQPQIFGGNGGQCFYRNIDPNNPKEKFLAMKSVKVPFRKPQPNREAVLRAIDKFCVNYKSLLIENFDSLRYGAYTDYKTLLGL